MGIEETKIANMQHRAHRAGWLRAAVLGANDGLVSTSALMVGVASALINTHDLAPVITAGIAGIAAGAMSMAAGEFVSVAAQTDVEAADTKMELAQLAQDPDGELEELTQIYVERGLSHDLARQTAQALTDHDALGAHLREELGHHETSKARPGQAAVASAVSFVLGALIPFIGILIPIQEKVYSIVGVTILGLFLTGFLSAKAAGCGLFRPTLRVVIGGSMAMAVTSIVGLIFGAATL
jgi:VIT1/CCC1 family predicted Fe2+/Mn2+ transporter